MLGGFWARHVAFWAALALLGCRTKVPPAAEAPLIKVLRVQNPSDDRSGAEHCPEGGVPCRPLAPGQEIQRSGIVRTFAGSAVTLDLGQGHHMDLGPLSETKLSPRSAELTRGELGVTGTPLIQKEPAASFDFVVGRRTIALDRARATLAHFAVSGEDAGVTLRRGHLQGADVDQLAAGDSIRLTSAGAFRTSLAGGELAPLPYIGTARRDFGELWPEPPTRAPRGLGTMTARVPNTDRVLGGVRLATHRVTVTIVDGLARTEVVEEFENRTDQVLEGRFRFPVPSDAAVSRLGLWVGDQLVEGEVVEAGRARAIYESIVDRPVPRDPALLEWVSAGEMSLKVFPIMPKDRRRVLLAYDQVLPVEGGRFRYAYPLSLGEARENTIAELSVSVHVLDTRGEIDGVRVLSHDARLGREGRWTSAYYSQRDVTTGRDFELVGERRGGTALAIDAHGAVDVVRPSTVEVPALAPGRSPASRFGHFALRTQVDLPESTARPRSIQAHRAIVLDVSYSQSRETVRAQAALALAIVSELEPEEGFVLLACDTACAVHAEPPGPVEARRQRAHGFLAQLRPGGASDLAGALVAGSVELGRLAARGNGPGRQLVVLSDGQASAGELSAAGMARIVSQHLAPANIDLRLVGVGRKLDHGQLESLAVALDAAVDYLPAATQLEQRMFEIALGLRQPVVREARVSLPSGLRLATSAQLPALRLGQALLLTGEVLDGAPGQLEISGRLEGAEYRLTVPLDPSPRGAERSPFVASLFARQRIQTLLAEEVPDFQRGEIVRLSTTYRTMSPYTSFLVLENDEMFRRFGIERTSKGEQALAGFDLVTSESASQPSVDQSLEQELSETKAAEAPAPSRTRGGSAGPVPASAPAPVSPPPAPKAKKASASSGSVEGRAADSSGLGDPLGPSRFEDDLPGAYARRPVAPAIPRAHLASFAADDVWRTWAAADLERVRNALARAPDSRSRMEEFVRRHLAQGRFHEAAEVARRFVEVDPDYLLAQDLLAQAAVVAGDHELARQMLDVQVETDPRSVALHRQAARAFENAGDGVRACAHRRALAELEPADPLARERASGCWNLLLGRPLAPEAPTSVSATGMPPQLRVEVTCDSGVPAQDCPSPIVVAPDGRITSPWTPGVGESSRVAVSLPKVRTGTYFVLLLGGTPGVRGRVALHGRHERTSFAFVAGGLRTVAKIDVAYY